MINWLVWTYFLYIKFSKKIYLPAKEFTLVKCYFLAKYAIYFVSGLKNKKKKQKQEVLYFLLKILALQWMFLKRNSVWYYSCFAQLKKKTKTTSTDAYYI